MAAPNSPSLSVRSWTDDRLALFSQVAQFGTLEFGVELTANWRIVHYPAGRRAIESIAWFGEKVEHALIVQHLRGLVDQGHQAHLATLPPSRRCGSDVPA